MNSEDKKHIRENRALARSNNKGRQEEERFRISEPVSSLNIKQFQ